MALSRIIQSLVSRLRLPIVRGLVLYVVLPNLALFLLDREFSTKRPLLDSDYLLLWFASYWLSRRATIVLYSLLFELDLIFSTESVYHHLIVNSMLAAWEFLEHEPAAFYSLAGVLSALSLAVIAIFRWSPDARLRLPVRGQVLLGIAALALSGATLAREILAPEGFLESMEGDRRTAGSGILETGFLSAKLAQATRLQAMPALRTVTADAERELLRLRASARENNVAIFIIESQGLLKDAGDMRRILAPLLDAKIGEKYVIKTGDVRYFGATMFGELRTLCRVYVPHTVISELPHLNTCLPNVLRRLGYETTSFHGNNSWFYERKLWYPDVGIERSYFAEELARIAPPSAKCGTGFQQLCDLWVADQVERELLTPVGKKKFVYWLTINSHLPVSEVLAAESGFDCAGTKTLRDGTDPCNLARIHNQIYVRIAQMVLNNAVPPTRFFIVGDHMPPFSSLSELAVYDQERVPFVVLVPRTTLGTSDQRAN